MNDIISFRFLYKIDHEIKKNFTESHPVQQLEMPGTELLLLLYDFMA
jgi:hypothetical protein